MCRAPQTGDARCNAGEGIGTGRTGEPHRRRRSILLMISMENENPVHRTFDHRIDFIRFCRHTEGHAEEVAGIGQAVVRIDEGLADRIFIGPGGNRRHFGDQTMAGNHPMRRILHIGAVMIKGAECADHTAHDRHGMRIAAEAGKQLPQLLMQHCVARNRPAELFEFLAVRQFTIQQEIADFHEVGLLGQLTDRVTAVKQNALIAIDERQAGLATRRGLEARIECEHVRLAVERADIEDVWPLGALQHGKLMGLALQVQLGDVVHAILRISYPLVSSPRPAGARLCLACRSRCGR